MMDFECNEDNISFQELHKNVSIPREHQSKRALQQVSTLATHKNVVGWMIENEVVHGEMDLMAQTIDLFHDVFCSIVKKNTNLVKAKQWWNSQDQLFPNEADIVDIQLTITRAQDDNKK